MSDTDRLVDYLARMDNPDHQRDLPDGCVDCGASVLSCNATRYMTSAHCCPVCEHRSA